MPGYICIHGHFYQPPRENPWLEAVELQDSAYPFHDWNERITAECYAPNAASRILDDSGVIQSITNNYARISFNFGPTLLSWLELRAPETYRTIIEADIDSRAHFSGHGSAMAQNYGHLIMPLASIRDRITQIRWGRRDFEHRFGRAPEGMWLAEAAVDIETLEIMAEHGIRFTVLSPYQAARVEETTDEGITTWTDVTGGRIDPRRAYRQELPSGRSIALFFYDGPVSQAVAFERLLAKGEIFADRLMGIVGDRGGLAHIATDGETYGHHHTHGDMALAYALRIIDEGSRYKLTNYGQFLSANPPKQRVEIIPNTSWSCAHGVERWRSHCGCHSGSHPTWSQGWRAPLRAALDWLRDEVAPKFQEVGSRYFQDPWAARDDYINVILDRSHANVEAFLSRHATRELPNDRKVTALRLMELQRHAMLMYTSCGWFFDDISGIETVQVIQYAGRVVQLARQVFGVDLSEQFATRLEAAESNVPSQKNGRAIYETHVKPFALTLNDVAAHYAVTSLFEQYPLESRIYCYDVTRHEEQQHKAGKMKLTLGRARIRSRVTWEADEVSYAAVHFGDHNVYGGVDNHMATEDFHVLERAVSEAFNKGDLPRIVRVIDKHFGGRTFSLGSLFRDEQRKLLDSLLQTPLHEAELATQRIYRQNAPLMRYLAGMGIPAPRALNLAAELALNSQIRRAFEDDPLDRRLIDELLDEARAAGVELASTILGYTLSSRIERKARDLAAAPTELDKVQALETAVDIARALPFRVALSEAQTVYYRLKVDTYLKVKDQAAGADGPVLPDQVHRWLDHFANLGRLLAVHVQP